MRLQPRHQHFQCLILQAFISKRDGQRHHHLSIVGLQFQGLFQRRNRIRILFILRLRRAQVLPVLSIVRLLSDGRLEAVHGTGNVALRQELFALLKGICDCLSGRRLVKGVFLVRIVVVGKVRQPRMALVILLGDLLPLLLQPIPELLVVRLRVGRLLLGALLLLELLEPRVRCVWLDGPRLLLHSAVVDGDLLVGDVADKLGEFTVAECFGGGRKMPLNTLGGEGNVLERKRDFIVELIIKRRVTCRTCVSLKNSLVQFTWSVEGPG